MLIATSFLSWLILLSSKEGNAQSYESDSNVPSTTESQQSIHPDNYHFPSEFQPIHKGDYTLHRLVTKYMQLTYPKGPLEEASLKTLLLNEHQQVPLRTDTILQKWFPIECKLLDLELKKVQIIHEGKRNLVIKYVNQYDGATFAWKRFTNPNEYTTELAFFMLADHPNIVKPICTQADQKTGLPGILMEYVEGFKSMDYARNQAKNPDALLYMVAQAYDVVKYMHWLGFVHADFKPENVLIDKMGNVKAIDFGFAIPLPFYRHYRGTPTTMAPELVKAVSGPIHENIDWWAWGSSVAQWYGAALDMPKTITKDGHRHKWTPLRLSKAYGYSFGILPRELSQELCQLLYFTMNPQPLMRMFNTRSQLSWLENLPFWRGFNLAALEKIWLQQ